MPGPVPPETLRKMVEKGDDTSFLIVDVRPPEEYRLDHIPGAVNIPLKEIEAQEVFSRTSGDVIFYCRNGMRSKVAAIMAMDAGLAGENAYNLDGGMAAYSGEILLELPRLTLWDDGVTEQELVSAALNLEKGAWRFYRKAAKMALRDEAVRFLEKMAGFETDHARSLFRRLEDPSQPFDAYFETCPGDILEGGKSFDDVGVLFSGTATEADIMDMALEIELGAYDLYKRSSLGCASPEAKTFFLDLAAAEKKHMGLIVAFISSD